MMQYSKGDTIKLCGKVVIVLNDGVPGKQFLQKYGRKFVWHFSDDLRSLRELYYDSDDIFNQHHVLYYILVGDEKGWYRNLEDHGV